jgi:hypothetical protein
MALIKKNATCKVNRKLSDLHYFNEKLQIKDLSIDKYIKN